MRVRTIVIVAASLALPALFAQSNKDRQEKIAAGDWPRITRDLGGTRYSPLDQINKKNVARLKAAWSYKVRPEGGGATVSGTTPIVVNGVMYLPTGNRIVALEPETGKELWRHDVKAPGAARRAVSYWPGDKDNPARLFFTNGRSMFALNAKTGKLDPGFGKEGEIELGVPYNSPPTIYKNVLIIGANVGEMPVGPPGNSRAYDARTGKKLWEFNSVPQPGEVGHETWLGEGWKGRSGTNVWVWYMTVDEESGTVYMPIGGPSPNYYGGDRPGNNLFANSVVAVDAESGKLKWYFQTIHHDLWDQDLPAPPTLVDVTVKGKKIKALAETGKPAFMYILDRLTGKPVFGVNEVPQVAGDVPGEWYSPTQPIPVKPPQLVRGTWLPEDVVTAEDTNEAHAQACREVLKLNGGTLFSSGTYSPHFLQEEGKPLRTTIMMPPNGGSNWGGTAADLKSGYLILNVSEGGSLGYTEKRKPKGNYGRGTENSTQPYERGSVDGRGAYSQFAASFKNENGQTVTLPCVRPPWGKLVAVNANTGEIAWQTRLGVTDELPEGKKATGRGNTAGGPIVTAGGLVFIGATDDRRFRAFDSKTGKLLWETKLEYNAQNIPITFRGKDGKQYVAVIAAGGGMRAPGADGAAAAQSNNQAVVAFALPEEEPTR
jgi:quinoprotein glucose dehydrogenase